MHMSREEFTPSQSIGRRIREERYRQGLTQEQLAMISNVATRSLHRIETGEAKVRFDVLVRILAALGLEIELRRRGER
jgi:transcriptional regulator with XRE-family HTH domain